MYSSQHQQQRVGSNNSAASCNSNNNNNYSVADVGNGTGGSSVRLAGDNTKDRMYEPKHNQKAVRVLTVIAYMFFVSLAAIMLSLYYVFIWNPPPPPRPSNLSLAVAEGTLAVITITDCNHGIVVHTVPTQALETPKAMPVVNGRGSGGRDDDPEDEVVVGGGEEDGVALASTTEMNTANGLLYYNNTYPEVNFENRKTDNYSMQDIGDSDSNSDNNNMNIVNGDSENNYYSK